MSKILISSTVQNAKGVSIISEWTLVDISLNNLKSINNIEQIFFEPISLIKILHVNII